MCHREQRGHIKNNSRQSESFNQYKHASGLNEMRDVINFLRAVTGWM